MLLLDFRPIEDPPPVRPGVRFHTVYVMLADDDRVYMADWDGVGWVNRWGDPIEPCCWAEPFEIIDPMTVGRLRLRSSLP
jgi:hypothetical protein